jgi:protein TonB
MQHQLMAILLIVLPLVGMGQGLRKKNAALEEEYLTKLEIYDSLFQKADSVNRIYKNVCEQLKKKNSSYSKKYTELMKTKQETVKNYKELMVLDSTVRLRFNLASIESVSVLPSIFPEELTKEKLAYVNEQPKANFVIYLEALSKKEQHSMLVKTIPKIEKETDSLLVRMTKQMNYDSLVSKTNGEFTKFAFRYIDSLKLELDQKNQKLSYELRRIAAIEEAKNGDGIIDPDWDVNLSYGRFGGFDDAVPPPPPPAPPQEENEYSIHMFVEETAEYPGGMEAMKAFIEANLKIPEVAIRNKIEGKCYVQFVVSAQGNISNVKVVRGVPDCVECDKEAIRVVRAMPKWKPGKIEGKPVNSTFNLPVKFNLP